MSIPKPPYAEGQEFTNDVTGVTYKFDGVKWIASSGGEEIDLSGYVRKVGGDAMQGPLVMQVQPNTGSRETNRVQTLGVFTNSESSALRLGTNRDRVYVGNSDTAFNGPIKVDELQDKNGNGVKYEGKTSGPNNIQNRQSVLSVTGPIQDGVDQNAADIRTLFQDISEYLRVPVTFKCKGYLQASSYSPPPSGHFCIIYSSSNSTSANVWFGNCNHSIKVHADNFFSPNNAEITSGETYELSGYVTVIGSDHKTYLKAPINRVRRNSGMSYVTIYLSSPVTTWANGNIDDASNYMVLVEAYQAS